MINAPRCHLYEPMRWWLLVNFVNDPVLCGVRLHLLLLVSSWLQTDITVNCSRQSFNIIQSQSKPFWLQISWCFSIPMSGSPDSSSDFLIPEERSFLLPEEPLPPPEEGCFPEEPLPEERFLLPEEPLPEEHFLIPEEPLPPPVQPVENLPPPVQPVENLPPRVQPVENLPPPPVQPVESLPLTNLPPLDSEWPVVDPDSDCDAETRDSLVVHCSDSDVFERLTWVHHQGDWRCVMSKHVEEIAMNLDLHETMDWLEYWSFNSGHTSGHFIPGHTSSHFIPGHKSGHNKDVSPPRSKNSLLFAALGLQWCQLAVVPSAVTVSDAWLKNVFVFALAKVWQTLMGPGQQWFWPQTVKVWLVVLICCDSNSLCFWYVWIQNHCFDSTFQTQTQCFGCWLSADSNDLSLILLSLMLNELSQTQARWSYIYI